LNATIFLNPADRNVPSTTSDSTTNNSVLQNVGVVKNCGSGFQVESAHASNANVVSFIGCDATDNLGHGFFDDGWNNLYFNARAKGNLKGGYLVRSLGGVMLSPCVGTGGVDGLGFEPSASGWIIMRVPTSPVISPQNRAHNLIIPTDD